MEIITALINKEIARERNTDVQVGLQKALEIISKRGFYDERDVERLESEADIASIASWIIDIGTKRTTSGNYIVYYDDIIGELGVTKEFLKTYHNDIKEEIDARLEIQSETWDVNEGGFDVNFFTMYCENVEDENEEV